MALCCEYRLVPISIDDVEILPGDFLSGDIDGVLVIPMGVVEEVLAKANAQRVGQGPKDPLPV